jgi:hypothetical protein
LRRKTTIWALTLDNVFIIKVADGNFIAGVKVLCPSRVAPYNEATMEILEAKHMYIKLSLWLKLTLFSGALNCFLKVHRVVEMVCGHNIY